ncbi:hypothetical protein DUNSADRAFT_3213 [Dunaliella salina]|uniref:SET domain-containing protein n=1 Tax=Dunaliella salina TaxID=3046 RepID=A0ABQ7GUC8_DUNSA|nr:hypothetical protein DUNSADRAFT_3213 [Dunaliella salina]|eukprot:KAF5838233.1 hypothetical protein DUNSADRAFT_3213 [Dunaliella salina]
MPSATLPREDPSVNEENMSGDHTARPGCTVSLLLEIFVSQRRSQPWLCFRAGGPFQHRLPEQAGAVSGGSLCHLCSFVDLTAESLELMVPAWPGVATLFPALMSMEVWGGLVGMFELNNLAMAIPSPVEDYFLLVDGLPESEKAACQQSTQKWLDALDKWYDVPAQGTGFMALQSCANHSCEPNAATEGEGTGLTAVYARRGIKEGEEVTITYIEEDGDEDSKGKAMSYKQRQAALQDYGFKCQCTLCVRDAAKALKKPSRSGMKTGRR